MDDYGSDKIEEIGWPRGSQALYWAVLLGLRETVKLLYDREPKPDVNHVAGTYGFPLQAAAFKGIGEVVNLLIDKGADLNLEGGYYGTALQVAVEGGDERIVQKLLQAGANPNCRIQTRPFESRQMRLKVADTLLLLAVKKRNIKMIQMMIQFGANVDLNSSELLSGCVKCENEELIQTLLQATSIDDSKLDEWLIQAIGQVHKGIIKLLLDAGANPNSSGSVHTRSSRSGTPVAGGL